METQPAVPTQPPPAPTEEVPNARFAAFLRLLGITDSKLVRAISFTSTVVVLTIMALAMVVGWFGRNSYTWSMLNSAFQITPFVEKQVRSSHNRAIDAGYSAFITLSNNPNDLNNTVLFHADPGQIVWLKVDVSGEVDGYDRRIPVVVRVNKTIIDTLFVANTGERIPRERSLDITRATNTDFHNTEGIHELIFSSDSITRDDRIHVRAVVIVRFPAK